MSKKFVLGASHSGAGKTTISMGIMKALVKRGYSVQPFKVGPDYIDPAFHTYVTGNKCRNLDSWMLEEEKVKYLYNKNAKDKDISVIEGVMGLFDGHSSNNGIGSTAHVSKIVDSSVVLIIDASGMAMSAGALVQGYMNFDNHVDIKYVIVNKVNSLNHYEIIKDAIEKFNDVKCIGYMKKNPDISLKSRHLGLIPSVEVKDLDEKLDLIARQIEETIDLDLLINSLEENSIIFEEEELEEKKIRLAVAYDKAFNFYYHDNLDFLEEKGAEIIYFSPMEDESLPENIDGIYIGGGFPEIFPLELQNNNKMKEAIRNASDKGMPIYAECGGLMYLSNNLKDLESKSYNMVGIFPNDVTMTPRLKRFGYVDVEIQNDCIIGEKGQRFRAHEFHRSEIKSDYNNYVYEIKKIRNGDVIKAWQGGYIKNNTLAQYAHIHFYSAPFVGEKFINSCIAYRRELNG
jgi:cobyrinic acid a,c-diamide synthase